MSQVFLGLSVCVGCRHKHLPIALLRLCTSVLSKSEYQLLI